MQLAAHTFVGLRILGSDYVSLPKVSVIVPHYNDRDRMSECLQALLRQTYGGAIEIIVVDNGSDGGVGGLPAKFPTVIFLSEPRPGSYGARNAGIARATGEILAFTDSDCLPDPQWLSALVDALQNSANAGFVGGDVRIRLSGPRADVGELYDFLTFMRQEHLIRDSHFAATANMATRRNVIDRVGVFNSNLRSGGDVEWGRRVFAAGYKPVFEGRAVIHHPARTKAEVLKKMRRVVAGMRSVQPRRYRGFGQLAVAIIPPFRAMPDLWHAKGRSLSLGQRIRVFMFGWRMRFFVAFVTIWYYATSSDAPRS